MLGGLGLHYLGLIIKWSLRLVIDKSRVVYMTRL